MRIKEDKKSYSASSVIRRDTRNECAPSEVAKHFSKKDTKKWCRGKVGNKHQMEWVLADKFPLRKWYDYKCTECGKLFDYWFESSFWKRPKPKEIP